MHNHLNHIHAQIGRDASLTPFSDSASEYGMDSPDLNANQLIDISANGFAIPSQYMSLPRSHPMQGRYYDSPVFEDEGYDSRSPSPGIREQVKRPLNAFMLYRKDKQTEIPTNNHQSVSRIIGAMWKSESADTKGKYNALAQKEREKHRLAYPGYKYSPKKRVNKDKKVRRTMSQAAHVKRQEEEKQILRQINKRSKSEGTLSKPLPEFLPSPKAKRVHTSPDQKPKSQTPIPESTPRIIPQARSHSAQPAKHDYSKFTSNPQPRWDGEQIENLNVPTGYLTNVSVMPEQYEYFPSYTVDYSHLNEETTSNFDSETEFTREFSTEANLVCSPGSFAFEESQLYGNFTRNEDIEIFRMNSSFANMDKGEDPRIERVQNVYAEQWSRESTVNPQDLLADNS
jgi:HMG (high mobility group) box